MFDEDNLHSLIERESRRRNIGLAKLLRESLQAASDEQFTVQTDGNLSPAWRERLRHLASVAEVQRDWHWWHKPPWSELKLLLVKEADYVRWLDVASGAPKPSTEPYADALDPVTNALRRATGREIDRAISHAYDEAKAAGRKPPNVKEIVPLVQKQLCAQGFEASGRNIQNVADEEKHKKRRRKPGATIASETRRTRA